MVIITTNLNNILYRKTNEVVNLPFSPFNNQPIAEVFANLATEVTQEVVFLENVEELNPDVIRLSNVSGGQTGNMQNGNRSNLRN